MHIILPNGEKREVADGSTALQVAQGIGPRLAKDALAAKINGTLADLATPVRDGDTVEIVTFASPEGKDIYWHSSSHLLAQAVLRLFPQAKLAIGPAIANGFYYDFAVAKPFTPDDLTKLETLMLELAKADQPIERYTLPRAEALAAYRARGEQFKLELLETTISDDQISFYRQGEFFDVCRGPHLPATGKIGAIKLLRIAGAYWRGDERNPMLQRIYGITFPSTKELEEYLRLEEEAKLRDHRKLGRELKLFSFHDEGPGFPFWHPDGMLLYNTVFDYWKRLHAAAGYREIKTPMILNEALWHQSGHWDNYQENMYFTSIDEQAYAVKPMNCPGGLLVYRNDLHSYREFPLRLAELGQVHRHEKSGVLHGLFRVRTFTQDDAHIFCLPEQVEEEILGVVTLIRRIYADFGFDRVDIEVSTRPAKSIGSDENWAHAESVIWQALARAQISAKENPGSGAFYGPKIDFHIKDCLGRDWQCGTIQVDFSMPERFALEYIGADGNRHRPVMLHRACFGSIERFIGIVIEHYGGAFPLWLAPQQARVISIASEVAPYAEEVRAALAAAGLRAALDSREEKLGYKIREAQLAKVPAMLVVGKKEAELRAVNLRRRDGNQATLPLAEAVAQLTREAQPPA
ncbi:MAG TPA: threonine--tRNA ligase [bacterium]|nr:threonine--tRNA ligase [bacterium]